MLVALSFLFCGKMLHLLRGSWSGIWELGTLYGPSKLMRGGLWHLLPLKNRVSVGKGLAWAWRGASPKP